MPNYSYFSRFFTKEYTAFIYEVTSDLTLPDAKLPNSLTFGMFNNATSIVSHSARSSKSDGEARVHRGARFRYGDSVIVFDESDIQKPYGKSFEALDLVQDGSREGRPVGKGYNVVGIGVIGARKTPFPARLFSYSTRRGGFKSSLSMAWVVRATSQRKYQTR